MSGYLRNQRNHRRAARRANQTNATCNKCAGGDGERKLPSMINQSKSRAFTVCGNRNKEHSDEQNPDVINDNRLVQWR